MVTIKRILLTSLLGISLGFSTANADVSGNVALTSNYVWRGLTQTDNGPALQGGINYNFDPGFYVGFWGSNVNFKDDSNANLELDSNAGYTGKFANGIGYDVGLSYYHYPKARQLDYGEAHVRGSYSIFNASIDYSNDVFSSGHSGTYYNTGIAYPIPAQYAFLPELTTSASVGYYDLAKQAGNSYADYKLAVSTKVKRVKFELAWTDTNHRYYNNSWDHAHVFGTVSMDI